MRRTIYPLIFDAETITLPETETLETTEETVEETIEPRRDDGSTSSGDGFRVILYNDDHHDVLEVAAQIHKATGYDVEKCWAIMLEAHQKGRAICYRGSREKCHRVTGVLREIRLQCEVDCD